MYQFVASFLLGQVRDTALDIIENLVSTESGKKVVRGLRTDAAFQSAFDAAVQRAAQRFADQYPDDAMVAAIIHNGRFWDAPGVRTALREVVAHPSSYLEPQRVVLSGIFADLAPHIAAERLDLAMAVFLACLADEVITIPQLAPIYQTQFAKASLRVQHQQLAAQQESNRLQAQSIGALLEAGHARAALLAPATPPPPKVYHNLPRPDYDTFVGRDLEMKKVIERLSPTKRDGVITIDGIGGVGKSALALAVAYHYFDSFDSLPEAERYHAIIWTSAKQTVLTADGIHNRPQVLRNLEDIYTAIAVTLGREDITRARPDEQAALVTAVLTERRTLLLVDNLETVDDESLLEFLRELPMSAKAIVTTRHRIDVAYPIRLTGLPERDGLTLIENERARKGVTLTTAEATRLFARTGGLPLAIVWSIGLMAHGLPVETVLAKLGSAKSDIVRFCFEASVAALSPEATRLLLALSLFAKDATREALGDVAGLGDDHISRDDGLAELERMSLVNKTGNRFWLLPLTKSFSEAKQAESPENIHDVQRLGLYFLTRYRAETMSYRNYDQLESDLPNFLGFLARCQNSEDTKTFVALLLQNVRLLWAKGYWTELHQYLEYAYARLIAWDDEQYNIAKIMEWLAGIYWFQGDLAEAKRLLLQALPIATALNAQLRAVGICRRLADIYAVEGDKESARAYIEQASTIAQLPGVRKYNYAAVKRYAASVEIAFGNYDTAATLLKEVIAHPKSSEGDGFEETSTQTMAHALLARVETYQRNFDVANTEIGRALDIVQITGVKSDYAFITHSYALLKDAMGEKSDALEYAEAALSQYKQLGMKLNIAEIEELIARLSA